MRIAIEPMREDDIDMVMEIEHQSFPSAWPADAYRREIQENRLARYIVAIDLDRRVETPLVEEVGADLLRRQDRRSSLLRRFWRGILRPLTRRQRSSRAPRGHRYIVGYAGIWVMVDESHLTTIAVRPEYRGLGIGELLVVSSFDLSISMQAEVMTLEVRQSNLSAQALYEKYGFQKVGLRRNYYTDPKEDAIIMTSDRVDSPTFRELFTRLKRENRERIASLNSLPPLNDRT